MSYVYIQQSAERPDPNQSPDSNRGYMILVKNTVCPYGTSCYQKSYSVTNYPEGSWVYPVGKHPQFHYHIAPRAKWTNGVERLDFNLY